MKCSIKISVIITTYNWPIALQRVLAALTVQTHKNFEVIVADDGSTPETHACVQQFKADADFAITHIWQPDEGFQAAKIRNKAAAVAKGQYLIFLDGDCIPFNYFIERHTLLAETGWLVAGNRILLNATSTQRFLTGCEQLQQLKMNQWLSLRIRGQCNRFLSLVYLPFMPRKWQGQKWQGAKTCNLGIWKADFFRVNGFDEAFVGWGHEDSDLVQRLIKTGVKRKDGRFAIPVIHCWHLEHDRALQQKNLDHFHQRLADHNTYATLGINQYL